MLRIALASDSQPLTQNGKDLLCGLVCDAQSIEDLVPLLKRIPFQTVQGSILEIIGNLKEIEAKYIASKFVSITDVLSDDIIQHPDIVSFSDSLDMKYVSKATNRGYNKHKALELKQRPQIIDSHAFNPIVKYEAHNNTWVIHPTRTHLTSEEIANGYEGPLNALSSVRNAAEFGDKLLFHDGEYVETDEYELHELLDGKDLQFIGVGNNVFINTKSGYEIGNNLYFKNVKIRMDGYLRIRDSASVSVEDCQIMFGTFNVYHGGTFNAKNCVFDGNGSSYGYPIKIWSGANVNVVGSEFTNHDTCIWFIQDNEIAMDHDIDTCLKCVANIFKDNCGYPIAAEYSYKYNVKHLKYAIAHNILEGYNGSHVEMPVDSANKMLFPPFGNSLRGFHALFK